MGYGDGHIKSGDKSCLMHDRGDFFFFWQPNTYVFRKLSRANTFASCLAQKCFAIRPQWRGFFAGRAPARFALNFMAGMAKSLLRRPGCVNGL